MKRGFTLIELVTAVSVLTILAGIIWVFLGSAREKARITAGKGYLAGLPLALARCADSNLSLNVYPVGHPQAGKPIEGAAVCIGKSATWPTISKVGWAYNAVPVDVSLIDPIVTAFCLATTCGVEQTATCSISVSSCAFTTPTPSPSPSPSPSPQLGTITLNPNGGSATVGVPISVIATVKDSSGNPPSPAVTIIATSDPGVQFQSGSVKVTDSSGQATFQILFITSGSHSIYFYISSSFSPATAIFNAIAPSPSPSPTKPITPTVTPSPSPTPPPEA